jgi:hypothetical protein
VGGVVCILIRPSPVIYIGKNIRIRSRFLREKLARVISLSGPDNLTEVQGWNLFPAEDEVQRTEALV